MDAESLRKTVNTFDLTTTNAIIMKLTTILYLEIQFFVVMSTNF